MNVTRQTNHTRLRAQGLPISERSVTNLLDRYDELIALSVLDVERLRRLTQTQGRVILALDGLQPDLIVKFHKAAIQSSRSNSTVLPLSSSNGETADTVTCTTARIASGS